jgi:hypothetical protein
MPNVPRETPTPIPIFLLSLVFVGFEDGVIVALGFVREGADVDDEEGEEDEVAVLGTKFQPFIWIPVTAALLVAVDIDVTHAEANSFEFVTVLYITRLICCPIDKVDRHSPTSPAPKLAMKK